MGEAIKIPSMHNDLYSVQKLKGLTEVSSYSVTTLPQASMAIIKSFNEFDVFDVPDSKWFIFKEDIILQAWKTGLFLNSEDVIETDISEPCVMNFAKDARVVESISRSKEYREFFLWEDWQTSFKMKMRPTFYNFGIKNGYFIPQNEIYKGEAILEF